eukprot:6055540-Pyramimonas_sp.AAC.1
MSASVQNSSVMFHRLVGCRRQGMSNMESSRKVRLCGWGSGGPSAAKGMPMWSVCAASFRRE